MAYEMPHMMSNSTAMATAIVMTALDQFDFGWLYLDEQEVRWHQCMIEFDGIFA